MAREYARIYQRLWGRDLVALDAHAGQGPWRLETPTSPYHVYSIYERDQRLDMPLYVGCTGNLLERLCTHRQRRPWWPLAGLILVERFDDRGDALEAEHWRIRRMKPLFNLAGNQHSPEFDPSMRLEVLNYG